MNQKSKTKIGMDVRSRRGRDITPDRARVHVPPKLKPFRRVQVVYYLCRNGQLEHPHFMEVSHLANQQLCLKDVKDRLTVLRGKGMPSLFSWSCKRSYKNGYVWNDLADNDVIYPAEGAEYVLKGSELIEGCAEKFHQTQVPHFQSKQKPVIQNRARTEEEEEEEEEAYVEEEDEEKGSDTSSQTRHSRCSIGVSTDEIEEEQEKPKTQNELSLEDASPPSTCSTVSEKTNCNSREDCEVPMVSRNSVFLQLIACGSSVAMKGRSIPPAIARKSSSLHKGVLCKTATSKLSEEEEINYMSENPRFGNLQSQEKEYFSGSIVESISEDRLSSTDPKLKKSNSYNNERSSKSGLIEINEVERAVEREEKSIMKGKCIPLKKSSCRQPKK